MYDLVWAARPVVNTSLLSHLNCKQDPLLEKFRFHSISCSMKVRTLPSNHKHVGSSPGLAFAEFLRTPVTVSGYHIIVKFHFENTRSGDPI